MTTVGQLKCTMSDKDISFTENSLFKTAYRNDHFNYIYFIIYFKSADLFQSRDIDVEQLYTDFLLLNLQLNFETLKYFTSVNIALVTSCLVYFLDLSLRCILITTKNGPFIY